MRVVCSLVLLIVLVLLPLSCNTAGSSNDVVIVGDTLELRYASLLRMVECDGYTLVDVQNPWNSTLMNRYLLVPKDSQLPERLPKGTLLRTPLDRLLVFSTVHTELLGSLGRISAVAGVCDAQYITQSDVREGLRNGTIKDCGSTLNINTEHVVQLSPEAVWVLPHENGGYGKLDKLALPLVECVEYMEASPLAGAEWVRFYGRLMGCAAVADSLFDVVEANYISLCDSIRQCNYRPTLMCELKSNSAWYLPSGGSTMGCLYRDAGADYLFADNAGRGSLPLAFETVLERAASADLWLVKYNSNTDKTYNSLQSEFDGYRHFRPFRERNIYACNLGRKRFYEETPFRPDILLRELAAIFHPEMFPGYRMRYYEKMHE